MEAAWPIRKQCDFVLKNGQIALQKTLKGTTLEKKSSAYISIDQGKMRCSSYSETRRG